MNLRRDVFQGFADPTRRAILLLLASHAMTAGAIAAEFDSARPTISKHIKILKECDLIEAKYKGREIFYEVKTDSLENIDLWLDEFRKIWKSRFDQLDQILLKDKQKKNEK